LAAIVGAISVGLFAFFLRFNAMGGALGGFDDEEFNKLTRTDVILAGEQPLRDFTDGELRGVWPSLTYEYAAAAQRLWGRNLLTHAALTCGTLAMCAALLFLFVNELTRSWFVALAAALALVTSYPHLYNYTKVLTLTIGLIATWWLVARLTVSRLAVAAAWTLVAGLFRHDLGVYMAVASIAGIVASELRPWRVPFRRIAIFAGFALVFSLPSLAWVARYEGILAYIADSFNAVGAEGRRLASWPTVTLSNPLDMSSVIATVYYVFWAVILAEVVVFSVQWRVGSRLTRRDHAFGVVLAATACIVNYFFLRSNLPARFGDAVVPVIVLVSWFVGVAPCLWVPRIGRLVRAGSFVLLTVLCVSFVQMNEIYHELQTGRFIELNDAARARDGPLWHRVMVRFREVSDELRGEPPAVWTEKPTEGKLAAARFLAECTDPQDRVLLATFADEIAYFARRLFAGGQRRFASNVLRTEKDQVRVLVRLKPQSVPVVITDANYQEELAADYPLVARYVESHYHDVGVIKSGGEPLLRVWVENGRSAVRIDPVLGFPCFK
jgi:hypothetical protein